MRSIEELRNDTPGVETVAHFNNCGSALPPNPVIKAQIEHLHMERDVGGYEAAQHNAGSRTLYSAAARLLGCQPDEIAFADSASRAWDVLVNSLGLRPGDEIVTSRLEFGINLFTLRRLAIRTGARVKIVKSGPDGTIDLDDLYRSLSDRTRLVAVAHAAGHYGGVNPVEAIGAAVAGTEAVLLVDATQSLGQMPVDVDAMGCHALTVSGRKWLRGPRGTGFLYVCNSVGDRIDPVTVGLVTSDVSFDNYSIREEVALRSSARRFEAWERNVAAEIGLAVAIEYLLDVGIDWAHHRITTLTADILDRLRSVPAVHVLPTDGVRSGIIGLTVPGGEPAVAALRGYLGKRGVNVSSMAYIDAPLDYAARGIDAVLRISPHYYNTDDEVDTLCEYLTDGLKALAA